MDPAWLGGEIHRPEREFAAPRRPGGSTCTVFVLGRLKKEDRLWMFLASETPASGIAAFSPHPGDRPNGQFVTRGQPILD
jgi:hypothetical protein